MRKILGRQKIIVSLNRKRRKRKMNNIEKKIRSQKAKKDLKRNSTGQNSKQGRHLWFRLTKITHSSSNVPINKNLSQ